MLLPWDLKSVGERATLLTNLRSYFYCTYLVEWGFKALKKYSEPEWVLYHQESAENRLQAGAARKINRSRPTENTVFKEAYRCWSLSVKYSGKLYYAGLRKHLLRKGKYPTGWGCFHKHHHQQHHHICKAEGFLPAASPSILSVGRAISFKSLYNLSQLTSGRGFQTVMVTHSSSWGQDWSGSGNVSLGGGWLMANSSNRSMEKKKEFLRLSDEYERHSIWEEYWGSNVFPCQAMCFASRCWIAKYMSHFSWQNALMKSSYLAALDF